MCVGEKETGYSIIDLFPCGNRLRDKEREPLVAPPSEPVDFSLCLSQPFYGQTPHTENRNKYMPLPHICYTDIRITNTKTPDSWSESNWSCCYNAVFCWETLGADIDADVILSCTTHIKTAADQIHSPSPQTPLILRQSNRHGCNGKSLTYGGPTSQPTGPKSAIILKRCCVRSMSVV